MEAVLETTEVVQPTDEAEPEHQPDRDEAAEFVTRQVLDRGATLFDG